jgi:acid phosphatase
LLGIGGLLGDMVGRCVGSIERSPADGAYEIEKPSQGHSPVKFGISGCHDTTLAGVLTSLGAYDTDAWPPFTVGLYYTSRLEAAS